MSLFSVTVSEKQAHLVTDCEREAHRLDISWHNRPDGKVLVMGRHVALFLDFAGITDYVDNHAVQATSVG